MRKFYISLAAVCLLLPVAAVAQTAPSTRPAVAPERPFVPPSRVERTLPNGLRILSSPSYGLEDVWRSQFVFAIGSLIGLGPIGLIKLAAFFGALKLAVACICAIHVADRLRSLSRGRANSEILEAALILIVAISIVSVGPASFRDGAELIREHTLPLLLAALATGLCIFERNYAQRTKNAEIKSQ